ncbi:MAG: ABC transporter permease [Bacteroidales bacterium]|nr:ABC transporter permease [Bacteroidales bacterium]
MNFPFYIAKRYLVAKKSHNAINLIAAISLTGIATGTMALVVVLSVFNGFDNVVKSLINSFNPDIKVILTEGKTFTADEALLDSIKSIKGVNAVATVLEDKALLRYDERQTIATVKGVSRDYANVSGIDSMITEGDFILDNREQPFAVIGKGIDIFLNVILNSPRQMGIYVPKRTGKVSFDPESAVNRKYLNVSGVFLIEQDYDSKYIFVPLAFAQDLFEYPGEINALEIRLDQNVNTQNIQQQIGLMMGDNFKVQNRYQQNEIFYKTMQMEKWAIFLILVFILIVASFNIIGTLTMLILEKKTDIITLRNLGASDNLINRIFLFEGWLVSIAGAVIGLAAGLLICWLQITFRLIRLQGSGTFIIDAYPVLIKPFDIAATGIAVIIIGLLAAWFPIQFVTRKLLTVTSLVQPA